MDRKERLEKLINKYLEYKNNSKAEMSSEATTRVWINEMLEIFGWDVLDTKQVRQEKTVSDTQKSMLAGIESSHTKPDYTLVNGDVIKAYLDAKNTDIDIFNKKEPAFQVRSYGWSAGVPCSFLTNFEQFAIFDCGQAPQKGDAANVGVIQLSINDYIDSFDILDSHLNRLLVYQNNLGKIYNSRRLEGNQTVDEQFNKLLSEYRIKIANDIYEHNGMLSVEDINYYVQVILDRIVFIRVCESRQVEKEGRLLEFCTQGFWTSFKRSCYLEFYDHYDGALFDKNERFQNLVLTDGILCEFVKRLYYPNPYMFNVIPTKIIAKIYEEFLAYSLVFDGNVVCTKLKEEYVKTNGAVPTHEYLADAICKQTLSECQFETVEDVFDLKILDPCCGSGVFLVAAYECLAREVERLTTTSNQWCILCEGKKYLTIAARKRIMGNCLYGIDIDSTAVEVTKMSLALKMIDDADETVLSEIGIFEPKILHDIHKNIKNGNTLVAPDIECNPTDIKYIKPFSVEKAFENVFMKKGGFDCIVGNPPYVETKHFKASSLVMHDYLKHNYKCFEGKVDLAVLFVERTMNLLNNGGILGLLIQRRWFKTNYGKSAREYIAKGRNLYKLLDIETNSLFKGHTTYVSLMILKKRPQDNVFYDLIKGGPDEVQTYFEEKNDCSIIKNEYFLSGIWAPELKEIFELKDKYAAKFGTIGSNKKISVRDGIQALWKKAYDIINYDVKEETIKGKNLLGEDVEIEKAMLKPIIYNREFLPLKRLTPDAYRIFPYTGNRYRTKMSIYEIQKNYPLAYCYLNEKKDQIMEKVSCNPGEMWATYTREHNHEFFESAKIIIPMTAKETYATYVSGQGLYMDNSNVWFINYDGDDEIVMKGLTMIVNSTIFSVLAKCGANQARNGYYKFNKQFIEPVPLPNEKLKHDNHQIMQLADLYDEIRNLLDENANMSLNEKTFYEGIMDARWRKVDDICYKLYEVDNEEKYLIESIGRVESRIPGGKLS